jgi:steroid 5-alpha reductase family enzyme
VDMEYLQYFLVTFVVLVALSIVAFIISRRKRKVEPLSILWGHIYNWLLWSGVIGLALLFFRYEGVMYLSMRFFLFALVVSFVFWGIYLVIYYGKFYKGLREFKKNKEKEKYFRRK